MDVLLIFCLLVCLVYKGAVMADRRFDTYMPGGSDLLEIFLESIMAGRYLFFAIKVM